MKLVYLTLIALFGICAVAAFGAGLYMIHAAPGLTLGQVAGEVTNAGDWLFDAAEVLVVVLAAGLGSLIKARRPRQSVQLVLWASGLTALIYAASRAGALYTRIRVVTFRIGHLDFAIRAPGYADLLLIMTGGLVAAVVTFAALAWLRTRPVDSPRAAFSAA